MIIFVDEKSLHNNANFKAIEYCGNRKIFFNGPNDFIDFNLSRDVDDLKKIPKETLPLWHINCKKLLAYNFSIIIIYIYIY